MSWKMLDQIKIETFAGGQWFALTKSISILLELRGPFHLSDPPLGNHRAAKEKIIFCFRKPCPQEN
jgi:hypothetical protein